MKYNEKQIFLMHSFTFCCILATVFLCSYWCYKFTLNEDLSVISYKEFHKTDDDIFPTLSLCLGNPVLEERLAEYGFNKTSYLDFLSGKLFDKEMLNINYTYVTQNIVDYIKGYRIYFRNRTRIKIDSGLSLQEKEKLTFNTFNGFGHSVFTKCFGLVIPQTKDMRIFRILLSNEFFPNSVRPAYVLFRTRVHFPKQFLVSKHTEKSVWPSTLKFGRYKTRINIVSAEDVRNRNKKGNVCRESWKDYDDWIVKLYKQDAGCTNPYQYQNIGQLNCNTKEEMQHSMFRQSIVEREKYPKPCKALHNVRIEYVENLIETINGENVGDFWFSIEYPSNSFKEIINTRYHQNLFEINIVLTKM